MIDLVSDSDSDPRLDLLGSDLKDTRLAISLLITERLNQLIKGNTREGDDTYTDGTLVWMAQEILEYVPSPDNSRMPPKVGQEIINGILLRNVTALDRLVVVGGIITAEIERRLRLGEVRTNINGGNHGS